MKSSGTRIAAGLALSVALASGPPAHALEIFGVTIFKSRAERDREAVIADPQRYTVAFNVTGGDRATEKELKAASTLWNRRKSPASGAAGLIATARSDYRALLGALYRQGRYGGVIRIEIDGRDATGLPPDTILPDPVAVAVTIDPGPVFRFGEAQIVNAAPTPREAGDIVEDPRKAGFASGETASSASVKKAAALAVMAWRQQGYPKARIADQQITADHATQTVDAVLTVDPGEKAHYGSLAVEGTARLDPGFVAFMAGLEPGREYDPNDLSRASKRLARLDVFNSQRFVESDAVGAGGELPIKLVVQERKPRRIGAGATLSTADGLGIEGYWIHRNLLGKAERLRIDARVAGIGRSANPRNFDYLLGATFTKPGILTPDTSLELSAKGEREVLPAYRRTAGEGRIGVSHLFSDRLSGQAALAFEHARIDDGFGTRIFTLVGLPAGLAWDSRDNAADATRGFFLSGEVEPFHEFRFSNTAMRAVGEIRAYRSLDGDSRLVAAGRVKAGLLSGIPIAQAPPDKLFFSGGGGSVRGYGYKSIGVLTAGVLTGGLSQFEMSAELRFRATDTLGVVAFADAGTVGSALAPNFSTLRYGAGFGVRYFTGLGPIRLDIAFPLNRRPGDPRFAIYAGMGQAF